MVTERQVIWIMMQRMVQRSDHNRVAWDECVARLVELDKRDAPELTDDERYARYMDSRTV